LFVLYCFECYVLICVFYVFVVPLPPGIPPFAVKNTKILK
jgi:hypothetical protein